ncbi:MAG TPA: hypothetical protein VNU48_11795 [Burkholderiaceae bacterium]|nr:hypothetical protein [Burkholderiaceae bacterium]
MRKIIKRLSFAQVAGGFTHRDDTADPPSTKFMTRLNASIPAPALRIAPSVGASMPSRSVKGAQRAAPGSPPR